MAKKRRVKPPQGVKPRQDVKPRQGKTAAPASQPAPGKTPTHARKVLVVDDYADVREMYGEFLAFSGFEVSEARHGAEAIAKALDLLPDVILMDLAMPGIDGWEATRVLKQHPVTKKIPVICITSHALKGERAKAMRAGCDVFVTKPCTPQDLVGEIAKVLRR